MQWLNFMECMHTNSSYIYYLSENRSLDLWYLIIYQTENAYIIKLHEGMIYIADP